MSRRAAKPRAASGKAFASASSGAFGAFSTATTGSRLSYLTEPPDFFSISDANVVVSFKNLLKKDATTKSKALEDLLAYTESHPHEQDGGVEEPVLEAWVSCDCRGPPCAACIVMRVTGAIIPSHLNRQFPPRA